MDEAPVVVTGAGGFVGSALIAHFASRGRAFRATVRRQEQALAPMARVVAFAIWSRRPLMSSMPSPQAPRAVHLAGRAHVLRETNADPAAAYASANVTATERIASAAVRAGVRRFVLTSSIKVNGEASDPGRPFRPDDRPNPRDDYARSKWSAEKALAAVAAGTSMVPIALRLPLVYGPGVKANFALLLDEVARRRLLPLAAIHNLRSVLFVGNLVDAIEAALDATQPLSGVHFVTDAESVSTPGLVSAAGIALGTPARLVAIPVPLLRIGGALSGQSEKVRRLVDTLEADPSSFTAATGWQPRHTLAGGLAITASWWRMRHAI